MKRKQRGGLTGLPRCLQEKEAALTCGFPSGCALSAGSADSVRAGSVHGSGCRGSAYGHPLTTLVSTGLILAGRQGNYAGNQKIKEKLPNLLDKRGRGWYTNQAKQRRPIASASPPALQRRGSKSTRQTAGEGGLLLRGCPWGVRVL